MTATFTLALAALFLVSFARPRARIAVPRTPEAVRSILAAGPHQGECDRCHTQHAEGAPAPQEHALIGPDDNTLCDGCHATPWAGDSYGGTWAYAGSSHGSNNSMIWPGPDPPARGEADPAGKCVNCHDPHGWEDAGGRILGLRVAREESLCLACHDGHPAVTDIRSDLLKPYRHPTALGGRHGGARESSPPEFAAVPIDGRHAECEDCHNPHVSRADRGGPPPAPRASKTLLGVSRVEVVNGAAGAPPAYVFVPASDTLRAATEYELCFKCHSSWTTQPAGQTDLARALNPNNASYHPVEALGANPGINPGAFTPGWDGGSRTGCGDCHGSDLDSARGPHGSIHRYILRQPYTASTAFRPMASDELCFRCHAWEVYGDPQSPLGVRSQSRFNRPWAPKGHAEHTAANVTCYSCHDSHGSPNHPRLIVTGRVPGLVGFTATPTGGTCSSTCHQSGSYDARGAP